MNTPLIWSNILAYSLQIGLVVGLGALAPVLMQALRIRMPRARLLYWQILLVACLALPWIRSWRQEVVAGAIQVSTVLTTAAASAASNSLPVQRSLPFLAIALGLLGAGIAIRLGCLIVGLTRLAAYRRRGEQLSPELRMPGASMRATMLLSDDVAGPVTFGWRDPVILLPADFPSLAPEMREAILCHELLHVERGDWLFTIAEELVRAVLWFHPAIWWVIGEIQLSREQTVDESVIEMTRAREPYVDALLLMAGASVSVTPQLDLAPAPMFLRRRHLKRRLMEVAKEVRMSTISKTRWICVMSAAVIMVAGACWLATGAFPLMAAPQVMNDAAGVAVNTNGSPLMHRSPVPYPAEALAKGIEGTVVAQLKLDANGEVVDAAILSGPDELRKSVLQSVLAWHFEKSAASTTRTVNIDFVKPVPVVPAVSATAPVTFRAGGIGGSGGAARALSAPSPAGVPTTKIDRIVVAGLSDQSREELTSKLTVHAGDDWSSQALAAVTRTAKEFDSHLTTSLARTPAGYELHINLPGVATTILPNGAIVSNNVYTAIGQGSGMGQGFGSGGGIGASPQAGVFLVGNGTTPPAVLSKVDPDYSEEARKAKYSGSVMLSVVVNPDGRADSISVVKSLGMGLDEKAVESVQKWRFRPGMNQGVPVNVRAQIEVNFRLLDKD